MANTKFDFDKPEQISAAIEVLEKAYGIYTKGKKNKIEAVEEAVRPFRTKGILPTDDTLVDALTVIDKQMKAGELRKDGERKSSRNHVINEALKRLGIKPEPEAPAEEQCAGQISMDELQPAEDQKPEMSDTVKLMRFLAGKFDELEKKREADELAINIQIKGVMQRIDRMTDYLAQILRKMDG